jgi:glutamine cyclotransferase
MKDRNSYKWIDNIVSNGGTVIIKCTDRRQFNYLRIYFYQGKGWRVRTDSKTLRIKITRE